MRTPDLALQMSGWRDLNPRPLRPELWAGRSMVVISAGRRPMADVVGRCWSALLLYSAAVQLSWWRRAAIALYRRNRLGAGAGVNGRWVRMPGCGRVGAAETGAGRVGAQLARRVAVPSGCGCERGAYRWWHPELRNTVAFSTAGIDFFLEC